MKSIYQVLFAVTMLLTLVGCKENEDIETGPKNGIYDAQYSEITVPTLWESGTTKVINCEVIVMSVLTIEPGCTVAFTSEGSLVIGRTTNGAIVAQGTADKHIVFTASGNTVAGSWSGLYFGSRNTVSKTRLNYCLFEYAGKGDKPCLEFNNTSLYMESCTIQQCAGMGLKLTGNTSINQFSKNTLQSCESYLLYSNPQTILDLDSTNTFIPTANKAIAVNGGTITWDGTLVKIPVDYTVLGPIVVDNAQLTIDPGTTLRFEPLGYLTVGNQSPSLLKAKGTASKPIRFTSAASNPTKGDWEGLVFNETGSGSELDYVIVEYAGKPRSIYLAAIKTHCGLSITHSQVAHSQTYGVWCSSTGYFTAFSDNTIASCDRDPICMEGPFAHTLGTNNLIEAKESMGILLINGAINQNAQWKKQTVPYFLVNGLKIQSDTENVTLTVDPGCTLTFLNAVGIEVSTRGCLVAVGTPQDSIRFTSINQEQPLPGDWSGIYFAKDSKAGNQLTYCTIAYAGYYTSYNVGIATSNLSLTHSAINHSLVHGITVFNNEQVLTPTLQNNTFTGNVVDDVYIENEGS